MKESVAFLTSPCAPAVMTYASVMELVAVANRTGVSRSKVRSIRHSSSPVPSGRW
jgi:hypothetical protein